MVFLLALCFGQADIHARKIDHDAPYVVAACLFGCLCLGGLAIATVLHEKVEKLEPVELITRRNTGDLPAVETLVRGSEQPPAEAQSELLRAARHGEETTPEQLLRAAQEK